jgi:hypothetical protein
VKHARGELVWTTSALRDLVYAGAVLVWSIVAFNVLVIGVSLTASLLVLIVGVFVWVGFAYIVRWTTWVDRRLAGWQRHERIRVVYRRPDTRGFVPLLKAVSSDPQTWRDLGWLAVTSIRVHGRAGRDRGRGGHRRIPVDAALVLGDL